MTDLDPVPVLGPSRGRRGMPAKMVDRLYADYLRLRSLAKVAQLHGRTRQAVYDVFKTHKKDLYKRKFAAGENVVEFEGDKYTPDSQGFLRRTTGRDHGLVYLHQLIWVREKGPVPKGMELSFINGDKRDVRIENLRLQKAGESARLSGGGANQHTKARQARRIQECMGWIVKEARKYSLSGIEIEDLIQEGRLAVVEADKRFDDSRGPKFLSYAAWKIKSRMQRYCAKHRDTIRTPDGYTNDRRLRCMSMDAAVGDDGDCNLYELVAAPEPDPGMVSDGLQSMLEKAMTRLPERTRRILRARFWDELSLEDIASEFGVSRQRIQQIEKDALFELRRNDDLRKEAA